MRFEFPDKGYTVYTKTGCTYCIKLKNLFEEKNIDATYIDCDSYITDENKDDFLLFMKMFTEHKTFPMVFFNKVCIGGFTETKKIIEMNELLEGPTDF